MMSEGDRHAYDAHIDAIMVQNDAFDIAKEEGRAEGRIEGRREGIAEGRKEGRAEGDREASLRIATKMKQEGLPISAIVSFTNLSEEEIENL